jgi:hypothetical protein
MDDEPVPKLPRGRGIKLAGPQMFRIAVTAIALVAVIVTARPCGEAVGRFVSRFGSGGESGSAMPRPGTLSEPAHYVNLGSATTEEEVRALVERERAAHGGSAGSAAGSN